ncbi:MAG: PIN domain-containing protein [Marinoscillum sp.]|uniref:PIN domain-containing protein n=1 Tax=Marinoscillum sp. TaxID=2024838 RepID=UPI0032F38C0E
MEHSAQEFYNALNRKLGVPPQKIKNYFSYFGNFELVVNNMTTINTAIDIQTNNQLSFWDSLIISAAHQANCTILLSEDLTHGQKINTLTIKNPFVND